MQNALIFGFDLYPYYAAGWVTAIGYSITFFSFLIFSANFWLSWRALKQNRKAEMYYKIRDYYLGYLDKSYDALDKDVFEISDAKIANSVFKDRKKELAILYRIPLLVERQFDFSSKFGHRSPKEDYSAYVENWFERENFNEMWSLMKDVFSSNKAFCTFMEDRRESSLEKYKGRYNGTR